MDIEAAFCRIIAPRGVLSIARVKIKVLIMIHTTDFLSNATHEKINSQAAFHAAVTYGVIEERYLLGHQSRLSYGIAAYADAETDATATVVASVHDVTSAPGAIAEIVAVCNRQALPPALLWDAVEDFLEAEPSSHART